MLTVQHRMPLAVMNVVSAFAYDNKLEMGQTDGLSAEIQRFMEKGMSPPIQSSFVVVKHDIIEEKVCT